VDEEEDRIRRGEEDTREEIRSLFSCLFLPCFAQNTITLEKLTSS
jgi:hypothetical protein